MSTEAVAIRVVIDSLASGGAEQSLAELVRPLLAHDIDLKITCLLDRRGRDRDSIEQSGVPVRVLRSSTRTGRVLELRRHIAAERPALMHTTLFEADVTGRLAAAGTGIPVLTSLVNVSYDAARFRDPGVNRLKLGAARAIEGWSARHLTTHFHAVTESVKRSAIQGLGIAPDRITVITRGRDPARLGEPGPERRQRVRDRLGLPSDAELVLTVGRQEYVKGHEHLLEALAPLLASRTRLVALIVGRSGAASARLTERHRHLRLGDRVRFLGQRDDIPDLLAAADVFAFPSLYEGFGGAVVEAMALALPVVSSDLPTLRDVGVAEDTALLVPPETPEALGRSIQTLLDDPTLCRRLGARGREVYLERFTIDRSARGMADLYRRVAGVRGPSEVRR